MAFHGFLSSSASWSKDACCGLELPFDEQVGESSNVAGAANLWPKSAIDDGCVKTTDGLSLHDRPISDLVWVSALFVPPTHETLRSRGWQSVAPGSVTGTDRPTHSAPSVKRVLLPRKPLSRPYPGSPT